MPRRPTSQDGRPPVVEAMEHRLLLATDLVITEFLAVNRTGQTDSDGFYSDWIEIRNTTASAINLGGWHLTNDPGSPEKWTFPSTNLGGGAALIVYASSKNRTSGQLHTNFRLDVDNGYLALVRNDPANTVASVYLDYPQQRADLSYGRVATATAALLASGAPARAFVPTDASAEGAWTDRTFDDTAWAAGTSGVGFDRQATYGGLIGLDVESGMWNQNPTVYVRIPFAVVDPADFTTLTLRMKYDDGFVAYLNGTEVARRHAPDTAGWNAAAAGEHPDGQAVVFESIDISSYLLSLRSGDNVLAIQGLNLGAGDDDFLALPELVGGTNGWLTQYYSPPTPGPLNTGALAFRGFLDDVAFSKDRGFYTAAFNLTLACNTPGAAIRYTTDGSEPSLANGTTYTSPVPITTTTALRAAAFKTNYVPSVIDTRTYLFLSDVLKQATDPGTGQAIIPAGYPAAWGGYTADYQMDPEIVNNPAYSARMVEALQSIPTLSIVLNKTDMFGQGGTVPTRGIYTNTTNDGLDWQRPLSLEWITADGSLEFQIDAGIEISGGASRQPQNEPKHSFRVLFGDAWSEEGKLNQPIFPDTAVTRFSDLVLRGYYNNSWTHWDSSQRNRAQYIHDLWARETQLAMGDPSAHGNYVQLYINGMYWGLYNPTERNDGDYAANYFGGDQTQYDALHNGVGISVLDGDLVAWNAMMGIAAGGLASDAQYQAIQQYLDVTNLADYMIVNIYGNNNDWPDHNWGAIRKREPGAGFKFFSWDAERILEGTTEYGRINASNASTPAYLYSQLRANAEFRQLFADRVHKFFFNGGALTPDAARARWMARANEIDKAILGESARWGDYRRDVHQFSNGPYDLYTRDNQWVTEETRLVNPSTGYFQVRANNLLPQLRTAILYPALADKAEAPVLSKFGGTIPAGFSLTMTNSNGVGTLYYTLDGTDPRLPGGLISPAAIPYAGAITLSTDTRVKARVFNTTNSKWSPLDDALFTLETPPAVRITELMYHPGDPPLGSLFADTDFAYVELKNIGTSSVSLAGMHLTSGPPGVDFTFAAGASLAAGQHVLVVANKPAFESRYGTSLNVAGQFTGSLSKAGQPIQLVTGVGSTVQSFTYDDDWYKHTDGDGFSLVVREAAQALPLWNLEEGWRASWLAGGSPGEDEPAPAVDPDAVVVNEVLAHAHGGSGNWIELRNLTAAPLPIGGWYLSDDSGALMKFRVPDDTTIPAGGYGLFYETGGFGSAFGLTRMGGSLYVSSSPSAGVLGGYRDSEDYGASDAGVPMGRYVKSTGGKDFVALTAPTPGDDNAYPAVGPVVLSEVMYMPAAGGDEYIELRNLTGADVPLYDPANPSNTWQFLSGITYAFPAGASIPAGGYALVVPTDPAAFRSKYGLALPVGRIFGPYAGMLSDTGETIELGRPGEPAAILPYLRVDRLTYGIAAPWPASPAGTGPSLERKDLGLYGNDVAHWVAGPAGGTPGRDNSTAPPRVASVQLNGRAGRGPSSTDPSGLGVQRITVTFSKPVTFASSDLRVERVVFNGNSEVVTGTATPIGVSGSGSNTMTVTFVKGYVADTWAKVTLKGSGTLQDATGSRLDGETRGGSGRTYIYDAALDLPSGNGAAGGDAVFYLGSLRGDFAGGPGGTPDFQVTEADIDGFWATYGAGDKDADFRGVSFAAGVPDNQVKASDIDGFISIYEAAVAEGRRLAALPDPGPQGGSDPDPLGGSPAPDPAAPLAGGGPDPVALAPTGGAALPAPEVDALALASPAVVDRAAPSATDPALSDAPPADGAALTAPVMTIDAEAADVPLAFSDSAPLAPPDVPALAPDVGEVDLLALRALRLSLIV